MNAERQVCLLQQLGTHEDINTVIKMWMPADFKLASPLTQRQMGPVMLYPSNKNIFISVMQKVFPNILNIIRNFQCD